MSDLLLRYADQAVRDFIRAQWAEYARRAGFFGSSTKKNTPKPADAVHHHAELMSQDMDVYLAAMNAIRDYHSGGDSDTFRDLADTVDQIERNYKQQD